MNHDLLYWLAFHHLPFHRNKLLRWLDFFKTPENFFKTTKQEWLALGVTTKDLEKILKPNWKNAEQALQWMTIPNHTIITLQDNRYPTLLKEISDPPIVLYIKGNSSALLQPQMAMVGSRRPTPIGIKNAEQFAGQLVSSGLVITSGLAIGIDTASHRGALKEKGVTIGICGTGLNHIYPRSNQSLAQDVLTYGGALVSEFALDMAPLASHFPLRNRIIAGLSLGVLVVEAAQKSGSLITARCALEQNKEVFALPGSIHNVVSKGCHSLIKQGAKLVENVQDILEELQQFKHHGSQVLSKNSLQNYLSIEEQHIFAQIGYEISPIDVIILRSGLTREKVSSILLSLELQGCIQTVSGGCIRII